MYESTKVPKTFNNTGVYDAEVPPVLIPNTEVKLSSAESTWLDTAWKDMSMPVPKKKAIRKSVSLFFYGKSLAIWRPAVLSHFAHQTMYVHVHWVCCSKHDALHLIQISKLIVCFVKKKTIVNIIPSMRHTLPGRVPRPREFREQLNLLFGYMFCRCF